MNPALAQLKSLENLMRTGLKSELIDTTINKLWNYEVQKFEKDLQELTQELQKFEKKYNMNSREFIKKFESGELGDEEDFFEWFALYDMHKRIKSRLDLLRGNLP
ncbi:MAG: hypothetical protein ACE5KE_16275 [Methanosarcinales archaeon]